MAFRRLIAHFCLALNNILLFECSSLFIHSPTEGHFGCFQVWAITSKVSVNIPVYVFVWT